MSKKFVLPLSLVILFTNIGALAAPIDEIGTTPEDEIVIYESKTVVPRFTIGWQRGAIAVDIPQRKIKYTNQVARINFTNADKICANLKVNGLSWRLPYDFELKQIFEFENIEEKLDTFIGDIDDMYISKKLIYQADNSCDPNKDFYVVYRRPLREADKFFGYGKRKVNPSMAYTNIVDQIAGVICVNSF